MALQIGFIPIEGGHYYREALEEVTRAEELGFHSMWIVGSPESPTGSWTVRRLTHRE